MVLGKHEIEAALHAEQQAIRSGELREDNPFDISEGFQVFCDACRRGNLKVCQEKIQEGVNINARDRFDYTPLILASLCGHYEVVRLLLESGALCERDTFQGERALYNALNDRIRDLLLSYDYSKSRDPLQPLAGHITSLLYREAPQTSDITITTDTKTFYLHKFVLSARSPYFAKKLAISPDTTTWKVPASIPTRSLEIAITVLYLGEVNVDLSSSEEDQAVLSGIEKLGRQLEIDRLLETILENDRRLARQRRTEEVERGRNQMRSWLESSVLCNQIQTDREQIDNIKWDTNNSIFADILLCATDDANHSDEKQAGMSARQTFTNGDETHLASKPNGIPIGPLATSRSESASRSASPIRSPKATATIFPAHRAMLIRSDYFLTMFSSAFKEAQPSSHLPVVRIDCSPAVLEIILTYLYTEDTSKLTLDLAIEVLFAADQLFIEKLKVKAATIISTLGNGTATSVDSDNARGEIEDTELVDIYDVIRAGWDVRMPRLEEFGSRYIALRLERYIDQLEFRELVKESADRIQGRQETDTIELIDDIRFYLSERFRLRFEDVGFDEMENDIQTETTGVVNDVKDETTDQPLADSNKSETQLDLASSKPPVVEQQGVIRTLDGEEAGDEFAQDAMNYQILLGKIDALLESLHLDA